MAAIPESGAMEEPVEADDPPKVQPTKAPRQRSRQPRKRKAPAKPPQPIPPPMDTGVAPQQEEAPPDAPPMNAVMAPQQAPPVQPPPVPPEGELVPLQPTPVMVVPPDVQQELDQAHAHESKNEQQQDDKDVRVFPVEGGTNPCAAHHHHKDEEQGAAAAAAAAAATAARGRKAGGAGRRRKRAAPGGGAKRGAGRKRGKAPAPTPTGTEAQALGPPIAPMSPYAFAEEAAAPTAQAPSAPLAQSSVAHYLEQAFPTSTLPAIAAVPQQQQQEQEQEQEAIVGPFSADELRRWHEWDEHSYHFGLLTRPDMSFAEDMFAWAVGVRAPPSAEDDFDMVILPPRDGTPEALGPPPLS